ASELRKRVKVSIAGEQSERMLQDEGGYPHVVCGNRRSLLSELPVDARIMMRGLLVCVENSHPRPHEESAQHSFVARPLAPHRKSGAQLPNNNERQPYFIRVFDRLEN